MLPAHVQETTAEIILEYNETDGKTKALKSFARYPLKVLSPENAIQTGFATFPMCLLGYGGGLVSGDEASVDITLKQKASGVLFTQASTKVFKAVLDCETNQLKKTSQSFHFLLEEDTFLAFLPDPTVCFAGADYQQMIRLQLNPHSRLSPHPAPNFNFVTVDWLTSGRKRLLLPNGVETQEEWEFNCFDSTFELYIDKQRKIFDRIKLESRENGALKSRMANCHVYGTLVIYGSSCMPLLANLKAFSQREKLQSHMQPVAQGRIDAKGKKMLVSVSPFALFDEQPLKGAVVRMAAETVEEMYEYLGEVLKPLKDVLGYEVYSSMR